MKISPEPLCPLRTWRELWHAEPLRYDRVVREQPVLQAPDWKDAKKPSFHWLSHLLNRDSSR